MTTGAGFGPPSGTACSASTRRSSGSRTVNVRSRRGRHISADTAVRQEGLSACNTAFRHDGLAAIGYSEHMASENDELSADFDKLARRYLDLWQGQLAGLAAAQALTEQIARLFAAVNAQVASAMQAVQGAPHAAKSSSSEAGTAPAAASSGHGADDLGELRKRVATLEARLAELEARLSRS